MVKPAVLVGMAVGDALGMPFEKPDNTVHPDLSGFDGKYRAGTWHKLPPGHWTDDTEMAVCLSESLIAKGTYDIHDVAARYCAWAEGTPHGMGGTTKTAMQLLREGFSPFETGQTFSDVHKVGSGTAMRIPPLGWVCRDSGNPTQRQKLVDWTAQDSRITHNHSEAWAASLAVSTAMRLHKVRNAAAWLRLIADQVSLDVPVSLVGERLFHASTCLTNRMKPEDLIDCGVMGRRGNSWQITVSALYCAAYYWDYFDAAVFAAVCLGGDTDTRAAITGGIMGARVGLDRIPIYLRDGLLKYEMLVGLDEQLTAVSVV